MYAKCHSCRCMSWHIWYEARWYCNHCLASPDEQQTYATDSSKT